MNEKKFTLMYWDNTAFAYRRKEFDTFDDARKFADDNKLKQFFVGSPDGKIILKGGMDETNT